MSEWIKVKDKLPPYNKYILLCIQYGYLSNDRYISIGFLTDEKLWTLQGNYQHKTEVFKAVKYWMPLPELPDNNHD